MRRLQAHGAGKWGKNKSYQNHIKYIKTKGLIYYTSAFWFPFWNSQYLSEGLFQVGWCIFYLALQQSPEATEQAKSWLS